MILASYEGGENLTYVSYENRLLQRNVGDWNAGLADSNLCRFTLVSHLS